MEKVIKVEVDLDTALGNAHREEYLANNPHGYAKVTSIHASKKTYKRCCNKMRPRIRRPIYTGDREW